MARDQLRTVDTVDRVAKSSSRNLVQVVLNNIIISTQQPGEGVLGAGR